VSGSATSHVTVRFLLFRKTDWQILPVFLLLLFPKKLVSVRKETKIFYIALTSLTSVYIISILLYLNIDTEDGIRSLLYNSISYTSISEFF